MPFKWNSPSEISLLEMSVREHMVMTGGICRHCKFCSHRQCGPKAPILTNPEFISPSEFRSIFHEVLKSTPLKSPGFTVKTNSLTMSCASYNHPPYYACAELFDHPQARELLEIIADEMQESESGIHICSIFCNLDPSLYDVLKRIPLRRAAVSANYLEPIARTKYMNSKDPEKGIENVLSYLNNFYDYNEGGTEVCLLYADEISMRKTCQTIKSGLTTEAKKMIDFTLSKLIYTRYAPKWLIEDMGDEEEKYLSIGDIYLEELYDIKDRLIVRNLSEYFDILTILEKYKGFARIEEYYSAFLRSFRESMNEAIEYINNSEYSVSDTGFVVGRSMKKTAITEFPNLNWLFVEPIYYSGNVSASSLVTFSDIKNSIEMFPKKFKLYIFTKEVAKNVTDISGGSFKEDLSDVNIKFF